MIVGTKAQVSALRELIRSNHWSADKSAVDGAVLACSEGLCDRGEPEVAIELITDWTDRNPIGLGSVQLMSTLARAHLLLAQNDDALLIVRRVQNDIGDELVHSSAESAYLRIWEGVALRGLSRTDESESVLMAVQRELIARPDSRALGTCAYQLAATLLVGGNRVAAKRWLLDAIVSARRCRDPLLEANALLALAMIERFHCRWPNAIEAATEAATLARGIDGGLAECHSARALAITAWKRGRLEEAERAAAAYLSATRSAGAQDIKWEQFGALLIGMIALHAGRTSEAALVFGSIDGLPTGGLESRPSLLTSEFLGDVHLEQGQAAEALRYYDEVFPKAMALVPKGDIVAELRRRRAECYLLLGRNEDAYDEAKTGLEHCRELGDRYEEAATYRVLALSAAAMGNATEAHRWFEQGFAYYDDIETPYEWGKLWLAYGDWLIGPNAGEYTNAASAHEAWHAARDHFERMGAKAKLAEAEARIATIPAARAATNSHPRRRPRGTAEIERRSNWGFETFGLVTEHRPMLHLLEQVAKLAKSQLAGADSRRIGNRQGADRPRHPQALGARGHVHAHQLRRPAA